MGIRKPELETQEQQAALLRRPPPPKPGGPAPGNLPDTRGPTKPPPGGAAQAIIPGRSNWQTRAGALMSSGAKRMAAGKEGYPSLEEYMTQAENPAKRLRNTTAMVEKYFPHSDPNNPPTPEEAKRIKLERQAKWDNVYSNIT